MHQKLGTLTKRDRKQLNIFERKVNRRILGPVCDNEKENWRILTLSLLMLYIYIYGAPSIARNFNVVYISTYIWQR
jgi:hypothetical protein